MTVTDLSFYFIVFRQHPTLNIGFEACYFTRNIVSSEIVFNLFPVEINGDALRLGGNVRPFHHPVMHTVKILLRTAGRRVLATCPNPNLS
jgi:hypothetical protein